MNSASQDEAKPCSSVLWVSNWLWNIHNLTRTIYKQRVVDNSHPRGTGQCHRESARMVRAKAATQPLPILTR